MWSILTHFFSRILHDDIRKTGKGNMNCITESAPSESIVTCNFQKIIALNQAKDKGRPNWFSNSYKFLTSIHCHFLNILKVPIKYMCQLLASLSIKDETSEAALEKGSNNREDTNVQVKFIQHANIYGLIIK